MKKRILSLLIYSAYWLVFFLFARLFFILYHYNVSANESLTGLLGTFTNGIMLDISTTGYYVLLPFLLMIPALYFNGDVYSYFMRFYTYVLVIFSSSIIVGDASLYSYWGFRMDYTPVFYLRTPGEAIASVSTIKLISLLLTAFIIAALFIWVYNYYVHRKFTGLKKVNALFSGTLIFIVLTGSLIIPVRGGFGIAPINAGSVYFSDRMFLNHTAINAVWNVGTTAFTQKPVKNPYVFSDHDIAEQRFDSLFTVSSSESRRVLNTNNPNILIIILESFSSYIFGPTDGDPLVTPRLNRIAEEGILFRNFYASGTRTDKAMPALLSGYPAQPAQSIIKEPKKSQSLPGLINSLENAGYSSSFWYGGEINFANFNSYIMGSGFNTVITQDNFDPSLNNSKWGVHDQFLFDVLKDSMKSVQEPFINVVLTLSSHEPYDVPMKPVFPENEIRADYRNSIFYTDSIVGSFIDWAKLQGWWKNTLVVLVADHGSRWTEEIPAYSTMVFRIPMVWTGGALKDKGLIVDKLACQTDLPLTLLSQLGIKAEFPFSKDIFCEDSKSFAFYTYNEGFGFLTDSSAIAYDHKPGTVVWSDGMHTETAEQSGKAFLQVLFDDYLKR